MYSRKSHSTRSYIENDKQLINIVLYEINMLN